MLENGISSHNILGRGFGLLDRQAVQKSFRCWVSGMLPGLGQRNVMAIDGKASRRSKLTGQQALHLR